MCFLQFDTDQDYLDNFDTGSPAGFIYVSSTPWFDLTTKSGRKHVVSNICGLTRLAKKPREAANVASRS